jgi:hypothetical protein
MLTALPLESLQLHLADKGHVYTELHKFQQQQTDRLDDRDYWSQPVCHSLSSGKWLVLKLTLKESDDLGTWLEVLRVFDVILVCLYRNEDPRISEIRGICFQPFTADFQLSVEVSITTKKCCVLETSTECMSDSLSRASRKNLPQRIKLPLRWNVDSGNRASRALLNDPAC